MTTRPARWAAHAKALRDHADYLEAVAAELRARADAPTDWSAERLHLAAVATATSAQPPTLRLVLLTAMRLST